MTKNNEIQTEYFGMITATINHQNQRVVLTLKRYRQPVSDDQVESLFKWALRAVRSKYPNYPIVKERPHEP